MKPSALFLRLLAAICAIFFPAAVRADRAPEAIFLRSTETGEKLNAIQTGSVEYRPESGEGPGVWLVAVDVERVSASTERKIAQPEMISATGAEWWRH